MVVIYIITDIKGSTIFARRISDGKTMCRDLSRFKRLNAGNDKENMAEGKKSASGVPPSVSFNPTERKANNEEVEGQESADNVVEMIQIYTKTYFGI